MIYDIDRVNKMLFQANLPTVEQGDLQRISGRRHYSLIALGLNRLETLYVMSGRDDERMTRERTAHPFRMQVPMTVGQRIAALEQYQDLLLDKAKPMRIERVARHPVDGMDERFGVPADEFRS